MNSSSQDIEGNVCEHCYQSAPDGKRFCSESCGQCELTDCDESKECAGVCLPQRYLHNADPNCKHKIVEQWSGVKCKYCPGWFCW